MDNTQKQSSFEIGVGSWGVTNGALTVVNDATAPHGAKVANVKATAAGNTFLKNLLAIRVPCNPGQFLNAYAMVKWKTGALKTAKVVVVFEDVAGVAVAGGNFPGQQRVISTTEWTRVLNNDNLAPALTILAEIRVQVDAAALNDEFLVDSIMVIVGDNIPDTGPHPHFKLHPDEQPVSTNKTDNLRILSSTAIGAESYENKSTNDLLREYWAQYSGLTPVEQFSLQDLVRASGGVNYLVPL